MEASHYNPLPKPSLLRPLQPPEILRSPLVSAGRDMFMSSALMRPLNPEFQHRTERHYLNKHYPPLNKSVSTIEPDYSTPSTPSRNTLSFSVLSEGAGRGQSPFKLPSKEQDRMRLRQLPGLPAAPQQLKSIYDQPLTRSLIDTASERVDRPPNDTPFRMLDKLFAERSIRGDCLSPKSPSTNNGQKQAVWQSARREHPVTAKNRPIKENPLEASCFKKSRPDQQRSRNDIFREQKFFRTPKHKSSVAQPAETTEQPKTVSVRQSLLYQLPLSSSKLPQVYSIGATDNLMNSLKTRKISCGSDIGYFERTILSIRDFQLGSCLGNGRFGRVFLSRHIRTNTFYAIKEIPREAIRRNSLERQLTWQIKLQSFLDHPNIVKLYAHFADALNVYLVMEYMEEGTLFDYLRKQKNGNGLPEQEVSHRMRQICWAVMHMHDLDIAHRDIKPENIVLSNGTAKLCDFGWATLTKQRRRTYCGTFDYSSPEMLEGKQYDEAVDLWSLGVLAYELLTGKLPFYSASRKETISNIINVHLEVIQVSESTLHFPESTSSQARSFIEGLLRKAPQERRYADKLLEHPFLHKYPEAFL